MGVNYSEVHQRPEVGCLPWSERPTIAQRERVDVSKIYDYDDNENNDGDGDIEDGSSLGNLDVNMLIQT